LAQESAVASIGHLPRPPLSFGDMAMKQDEPVVQPGDNVEQEFKKRKSQLESKGESLDQYRDGTQMVTAAVDKSKGARKSQFTTIGKAQDMGLISSRTGADAVTGEGTNPFAVSAMGTRILMRFRQKAMLTIILQSIFINAIAFMVDREIMFELPAFHWAIYLGTWLVPIIILFFVNMFRYKSPINFILLGTFSVVIGITFGLLQVPMERYTMTFTTDRTRNWSPQCYGMAGHTIALIILSLITCIPHGSRGMVKMAPVAILIAFVTDIAGILAYTTNWNYIGPPVFVIIAILMNTLSLAWIGYQMDMLTMRLQVDEFLYPVILLWCEVFIVLFLVMAFLIGILMLMMGEGGGGEGAGFCDGCGYGCYGVYCDCYYGGSGSANKARNDDGTNSQEDSPAPAQQDMSTEV